MLIPTDFFHLAQGRSGSSELPVVAPWAVLSPRTYRLDLVLFYDSGIWRALSVYFNVDTGYRFHSSLYLNHSPPTDEPPSHHHPFAMGGTRAVYRAGRYHSCGAGA